MAGHKGIEGNELVDGEAKEAAKGRISDTEHPPRHLRKPLLTNPLAVKKVHNKGHKKEWHKDWRNLEQGKVTTRVDVTIPSSKFLKSISNPKLSRTAASTIAQFRLMHIPLNGYC